MENKEVAARDLANFCALFHFITIIMLQLSQNTSA